jgi:phosphatidylglycerophosphatase A
MIILSVEADEAQMSPRIHNFATFLASGAGSGLFPYAPGTAGSIAGALCLLPLGYLTLELLWLVWAISCGLAVWSAGRAGTDWEVTDHPAIVIDEVVGVWLAYLIPITLLAVEFDSIHLILIALVLFRLYDIVKPWPVNWVERRLPGGVGVVADDLVAGAMAGFTAVIVLMAQSVV